MANTAIFTNGTWNVYDKHSVARVSLVNDDAHIFDLIDEVNDVEQGTALKAGAQVGTELQLRVTETPAIGDEIAFVCSVPLIYESYKTSDQFEYNFYNKKGSIMKCYEVRKDNVIGVSNYAITPVSGNTDINQGELIVVDGSRGWKALAAGTDVSAYGFVAEVIGFEKYQYDTVVLFRVVRNTTIA